MRTPSGEWKPIVSVNHAFGEAAVYNFEVERNHDYFVGRQGVLVHNQTTCGTAFTVTKDGIALPHPKYEIPANFVENPNRAGSYGEIVNGKFAERIRIDPATPKYPTHYHLDGGKEHLFPGSSKGDPGFP